MSVSVSARRSSINCDLNTAERTRAVAAGFAAGNAAANRAESGPSPLDHRCGYESGADVAVASCSGEVPESH